MIITRTPYRISFFGGGSDYPAWFRRHGGAVLAATIDRYCHLTCRYLPPFFEHRFRVVYSVIEDRKEISEILHPVVREALLEMGFQSGLEIHHDGDLPARSGIGSSSSFTVGLLHALRGLKGELLSKRELATAAIEIEQKRLRENVGIQDQILAAYGGLRQVEIPTTGEFSTQPLALGAHQLDEFSSWLMLFYTGIKRVASDVAATYVHQLEEKSACLEQGRRNVSLGAELLASGRLADFAMLLHESWLAKKGLSAVVSNAEVDAIYDAARDAGALGGKLLGAGGGGFMLLMVPPESQATVRERLKRLIRVPFSFEKSGSQIIYYEPEKVEEPV